MELAWLGTESSLEVQVHVGLPATCIAAKKRMSGIVFVRTSGGAQCKLEEEQRPLDSTGYLYPLAMPFLKK